MLRKNHFTQAVLLYANVSPAFKKQPGEDRKTEICCLLEEREKMRPKDIKTNIGVHPAPYLKELLNERIVKKERYGKRVYYRLM